MNKQIKLFFKKSFSVLLVLALTITSLGFPINTNAFDDQEGADSSNTRLVIQNVSNTISIDPENSSKLIFKIGDNEAGYAIVTKGDTPLSAEINNGKIEFILDKHIEGEDYQVTLTFHANEGYDVSNYMYHDSSEGIPGDKILHVDIDDDDIHTLDVGFEAENDPSQPSDNEHRFENMNFPIMAVFDDEDYSLIFDNNIYLDNDFTGKISFSAIACKMTVEENGEMVQKTIPFISDDPFFVCDEGTQYEEPLRIEGIVGKANGTVTGGQSGNFINVLSGFENYKNETIHLENSYTGGPVSKIISVSTMDAVLVTAEAPIDMSYGVGSIGNKQTVLSKSNANNVSVFFGNTIANLNFEGLELDSIVSVDAYGKEYDIDGLSVGIEFPSLSLETTSKVSVTIKYMDQSTKTYDINIIRTALSLKYDREDKRVRAGYVMNKDYLYNGQLHNDAIFNAYLQVIYYKDGVVAGFKQIKIDDESKVNSILQERGSWSIEWYDNDAITIFDRNQIPEGVNSISVFLTNGPISLEGNLPSIEYGIGAGLKLAWEE